MSYLIIEAVNSDGRITDSCFFPPDLGVGGSPYNFLANTGPLWGRPVRAATRAEARQIHRQFIVRCLLTDPAATFSFRRFK